MVISKFICIPLIILVPLTILFFESRSKDFTQPPSDEEAAKQVEAWKATNPSLQHTTGTPVIKPKDKIAKKQNSTDQEQAIAPDSTQAQPSIPKVEDATKGLDLDLSPGLNHLQGMKAKRLKLLILQLDPNLYPELIYLANERLLDSAHEASVEDIHAAGAYLNEHPRPLWNPEPSTRLPLKIQLNVDVAHFEKAKELAQRIETSIFWGSGGTVQPSVHIPESDWSRQHHHASREKGLRQHRHSSAS